MIIKIETEMLAPVSQWGKNIYNQVWFSEKLLTP